MASTHRSFAWLVIAAHLSAGAPLRSEIRSPLPEATAISRQLASVAAESARSIYAVTAFAQTPADPALYAGDLRGDAFAALAERHARSCGAAFAIDAGGLLLTNEHVVGGAASVWVTDDAGRVLPALVVGTDPRGDLAVLYVPTSTRPLPIADVPPTRGELVLTLGNPDGLSTAGGMSASVGCVSATRRSLPTLSAREGRDYDDLIQVTTPIGVGSSGGPLVDLAGRVVGIVSAVATDDRDGQAVGFALPLSPELLVRIERLSRGEAMAARHLDWAGVRFVDADGGGVRVARVGLDATLPLAAGSVVRSVNEVAIADLAGLLDALHAAGGQALTLDADEP